MIEGRDYRQKRQSDSLCVEFLKDEMRGVDPVWPFLELFVEDAEIQTLCLDLRRCSMVNSSSIGMVLIAADVAKNHNKICKILLTKDSFLDQIIRHHKIDEFLQVEAQENVKM